MRNILSGSSKFTQVSVTEDKQLNFIVNVEKSITDLLKDLKNSEVISETVYKSLKLRSSMFGILYGLCKVHKLLVDNCPPFRPITSVIKTPAYNLAKFLVPLLEPITANMYTVEYSFEFAKETVDQDPGLFMVSMDVESLFTDIPLEETISVCCDSFFINDAKVNNINRIDFKKLLRAALQNNFFNFEGNIYKQFDGFAMGSLLGHTLANAFLCFQKPIWLNQRPGEFKSVYYSRYLDSIFVLFRSPVHLEKFQNCSILNIETLDSPVTKNIIIPCLDPFIDVLITRTSNDFKTSVYHKSTFEYIQISTVSQFYFHFINLNVFNCFGFFYISFRGISFKRNIKKERISYEIDG